MMTKLERKFWKKSKKYVGHLRCVPYLRMVGVCNSLAFGKVDKKSDIDLFIIAEKGKLFTVRFLVTLILHFSGVRRHGDSVAGRFCLSFFVDDSVLKLKKIAIKNDVYLAYWIKSMKPMIDDGVSEEFMNKNKWMRRYFEEKFELDRSKKLRRNFFTNIIRKLLGGVFGERFERFMRLWQMRRAKKKAKKAGNEASIVVTKNMLKFHNVDARKKYRDRWKKKYGKKKITDERFMKLLI